jgi:hypothetical protein
MSGGCANMLVQRLSMVMLVQSFFAVHLASGFLMSYVKYPALLHSIGLAA